MIHIQKWKDAHKKRCKICCSNINLLKNGNYCILACDRQDKIRFQVSHKIGVWEINYLFIIHLVPGWSYWLWCLFVELYLLGLLPCLSWSQRTCALCLVIQRCNQKLWSLTCLVLWRISCELGGDTSSPAETDRRNDNSVTISLLLAEAKTCFFNTSWILPLKSQYILSTILFVVKNKELFTTNQEIHNINTFVINANVHNFPTRSHNDLHLPIANLSVFQKGVYFSGVKIFNNLPTDLKETFYDVYKFKKALTHWRRATEISVLR